MTYVNTVLRAMQILKLLAKRKEMTITEISNNLDIPKSSTFDIISTLKKSAFVEVRDEKLKTYSLGIASFEVGSAYLSQINLTAVVTPYLEALMNEFMVTSFLVVEDHGEVVYVDKVEPTTTTRTTLPLGSRRNMYNTALGKSILACYSAEKVREILGDESLLKAKTKRTITNYRALLKDLELTRARGYAIDNGEDHDNVFCLAAPLLNDKSEPVAAISLSFLYYEIKNFNMEIVANKLKDTALEISRRLGYQGDNLFT